MAPSKGSKLYVVSDPAQDAKKRLMKAVEGEGMPRYLFIYLFIIVQQLELKHILFVCNLKKRRRTQRSG